MDFFHLAFLALLQGLSEFLPISSSGHLALVAPLFGWPDQGLAFDIAVHGGTLLAVLVYCRRECVSMIRGVFSFFVRIFGRDALSSIPDNGEKMAFLLILATLPVVIAGFILHDWVASMARNPLLIGTTTLGFGLLLGIADLYGNRSSKAQKSLDELTWQHALWIGLWQMLAIIPGVSRSGITVTAARFLSIDRAAAMRFSFLLAIPTIGGALTLGISKQFSDGGVGAINALPLAITDYLLAALLAALTAFLAMGLLIRWLQHSGFWPFVLYRIVLGMALIIWGNAFLT